MFLQWNDPIKEMTSSKDPERIIAELDSKKSKMNSSTKQAT